MFGMTRKEHLLNRMKQSGIPANGIVTAHCMKPPYPDAYQAECTEILGARASEFSVQITFPTQEHTTEIIHIHGVDPSAYPVGMPVMVRYLYENGTCFALPEIFLNEPPMPLPAQKQPRTFQRLLTVLIAIAVFAVSAAVTMLVIGTLTLLSP